MNYKHLSKEERSCIRKYYVEGLCAKISSVSSAGKRLQNA